MKLKLLAAAILAVASTAAPAALVNFSLSGVFDQGTFSGQSFTGIISYDDALSPTFDGGYYRRYSSATPILELTSNGVTTRTNDFYTYNLGGYGFELGGESEASASFSGETRSSASLPSASELAALTPGRAFMYTGSGRYGAGSFTLSAPGASAPALGLGLLPALAGIGALGATRRRRKAQVAAAA